MKKKKYRQFENIVKQCKHTKICRYIHIFTDIYVCTCNKQKMDD